MWAPQCRALWTAQVPGPQSRPESVCVRVCVCVCAHILFSFALHDPAQSPLCGDSHQLLGELWLCSSLLPQASSSLHFVEASKGVAYEILKWHWAWALRG